MSIVSSIVAVGRGREKSFFVRIEAYTEMIVRQRRPTHIPGRGCPHCESDSADVTLIGGGIASHSQGAMAGGAVGTSVLSPTVAPCENSDSKPGHLESDKDMGNHGF